MLKVIYIALPNAPIGNTLPENHLDLNVSLYTKEHHSQKVEWSKTNSMSSK